MSIEEIFITPLESLKLKLERLSKDQFSTSFKRIEQREAASLLQEIEELQRENKEMKLKLAKISDVLNGK